MPKPQQPSKPLRFAFRPGFKIGEAPAEYDPLLLSAFVETGALDAIRSPASPQSVIVGRTGAGKTALLLRLERGGAGGAKVLRVHPASLALSYVNNSSLISGLIQQGVNFDSFYQLLWRHVFVTEVLRAEYGLVNAGRWERMISQLTERIKDRDRSKAERRRRVLEFYRQRNPSFWEDADVRAREVVQSLEGKLGAGLGAEATAELRAGRTVTEQIVPKAQRIVTEESLHNVLDAFDLLKEEALADPQKRYFVVVDDLDKNWVEADFAYDLIAALLDVAGDFAKIESRNIKIVVALRENIVEALLKRPAQQRQQREKYEALFYRLHWSRKHLVELAERRLTEATRGEYGKEVTLETLLPQPPAAKRPRTKGQATISDYLLRRTFMRPRDMILLVNRILDAAGQDGANQVAWSHVRRGVRDYSAERLRSLADEWGDNYPGLESVFRAFMRMRDGFRIGDVEDTRIEVLANEGSTLAESRTMAGHVGALLSTPGTTVEQIVIFLVRALYQLGALGLKNPSAPLIYSFERGADVAPVDLTPDTKIFFHPALYDALYVINPEDPSADE